MLLSAAGHPLAFFRTRLGAPDLALVAFYLAAVTLFGLRFRNRDRSLRTYFLADQKDIWLFPTKLARGNPWIPTISIQLSLAVVISGALTEV